MIIEVDEVPDAVLDALLEAAPFSPAPPPSVVNREDWRQALAAALTQWEKSRPPLAVTYARGHECTWRAISASHRDMMLGVKQTDVTMKCDGCGDLTSRTLNGTVTLEELRA